MHPVCSIIIPTYRRPDSLCRTLLALTAQTVRNFEVIVASDGPAKEVSEAAGRFASSFPTLRICEQPHKGRAATRNFGAAQAHTELLIFCDDDIRATPGVIAAHLSHHASRPGSILGGNALEERGLAKTDFQVYRAALSRRWTEGIPRGRPIPKSLLFLTAAHFSISKATFESLQGFDERLTDCEDFEFAARAHLAGVDLYFDRELVAWHDDFPTFRNFIKRQREYQAALKALYALKPELLLHFPARAPKNPHGIKRGIYRIFAKELWAQLIESGLLGRLLPKSARHRIYDLVGTAMTYFPDAK